MAIVNKTDLQYEYNWTAYNDDDPKVSGEPDSTLLSRTEGYEVLYFINKLCNMWNIGKPSGLKIERMLRKNVPTNIRSQRNIKDRIYENWDKY